MTSWKRLALAGTVILSTLAAAPATGRAENAEVLPQGRFAFNVNHRHYFPWSTRFDKNGDRQDAAADFNGSLDTRIIPTLALFSAPPFNLANPNLGNTVVTFKYEYDTVEPTLAYGITERLSFGLKVPYIWYKNTVTARLDNTNANIGLNPAFNPGAAVGPTNLPLIPVALGGVKLSTEDLQNLLGPGLPGLPGYGFKRFQSWSDEGLGDIEAGFKYQYYSSDVWRLALGVGTLFPTGKLEDIDNLTDQPLGGGSFAPAFRAYQDFSPLPNLVLNATFMYTLTLPYTQTRRISDPHEPLTNTRQRVEINPGDIFEIESSIRYDFGGLTPVLRGTSVELLYHFTDYFRSSVPAAPILERETNAQEQMLIVSLGYSTIPLFLKKEFPVPLNVYLGYRDKFAGNNNIFATRYINAGITVFF